MSKATLATKTETRTIDVLLQTLRNNLEHHVLSSYASTHHPVTCIPQETDRYRDSHGDIIGTRLLEVPIGGVTYYVPCMIVIGDVPVVPP
jgi:hypothetical protein